MHTAVKQVFSKRRKHKEIPVIRSIFISCQSIHNFFFSFINYFLDVTVSVPSPLRLPGVTGSHVRTRRIDVSDGRWLVLSRIRWGSGPGLGKKNRSEEDLVTVRFDKYPSRVANEGLGKNLQFLWVFALIPFMEHMTFESVKCVSSVSRLFMIELKMASSEESFAFARS